jgi:GNAT superfamily N-acetyltransferase
MDVRPLTRGRLPDLSELFATTAMTSRCHCTYVLLGTREREAVWRAGRAREVLERRVEDEEVPLGVLAYEDHAQGWCAVGPRSRYSAVRHSPLWKDRDETEDDGVWLVACFYVRARARHAGVTTDLLEGAVRLAADHGAHAIEGMPRAAGERVDASSSFVGFEQAFTEVGFVPVRRPSGKRVLMRRDL